MDEQKFMELVAELMEQGFSQQEAIEEARERLSKDMAVGGRVLKQTGGITMGNTLAENIARNRANQAAVGQMFDAARKRLREQSVTPFNPEARSQARAALFGGPPSEGSTPSSGIGRTITPMRVPTRETPPPAPPIAGLGGLTPEAFDKLSEAEQIKRMDADAAKFEADLQKFGNFADGREVDIGAGRIAYQDLLRVFQNDYPDEFAKLTGNETLAELDQKLLDLGSSAFAVGGRVGYQTGGVTESRQLPPEYVEALGKTYAADLTRQAGLPTVTTAVQQQPGETAAQFAQRQAQAQQFNITRAGMAELAPQVAAQDPLQAAAYAQAVDPTKGLGSFQPFLTKATTAADAATALTGTGAGTGAGSIASYQSPYQQQVIDATLQEFDRQTQIQKAQQAASALGTPGAFGGGREGVLQAEFLSNQARNRANIQSNLLQQGFQNAAARRQQDLANQMSISNQQRGLGAAAQDFSRAQISGLGTLGAAQQAQSQVILDAQRQAAQMAIQDPQRRLNMLGSGVMGLMGGMGAGRTEIGEAPAVASASPLQSALGFGLMGADIYGRIFGRG